METGQKPVGLMSVNFELAGVNVQLPNAKHISECNAGDLDTQCIINMRNAKMVSIFIMMLEGRKDNIKTIVTTPMIANHVSVEFGFLDNDESNKSRETFHDSWDSLFDDEGQWDA